MTSDLPCPRRSAATTRYLLSNNGSFQLHLFPENRFQHFRQQTFEVSRGPGGHLRGEFIAALEQISGIR